MDEYEISNSREMLVVKHNDLIQKSRYSLSVREQKLIAYVISKIRPEDEELKWYELSVDDFCQLSGIPRDNFYTEIKQLMANLDDKKIFLDTDKELTILRWFSEFHYMKGEGKVKLLLHSSLREYLLQLKDSFTQYELLNILALKGKYSIRLYEWFKSYSFMKEKEIELEDLKKILMAEHYTAFKDFRRRALETAINEINEYTDLEVSYETIKCGHSVKKLKFTINTKGTVDRVIAQSKTRAYIDDKNGQIRGQMNIADYMK